MQKKKLDLNHLLAKYQGISGNVNSSPLRQNNQQRIQQEFYQYPAHSRTIQETHFIPEKVMNNTHQPIRTAQGTFNMSKSEVESFLLSLKEDIRNEERSLSKHADSAIKTIHENFQRNHEKLRRQILQILERSFQQNERAIKEQLARQSKTQTPEFSAVYRRISTLDQDIDRLINSLRGPEYRKTIAEVVTRDFSVEVNDLKVATNTAKNNYIQSLGEIEPDRSRIEVIKDNLQKLFFINKKNTSSPLSYNQPPPQRQQSSGIFGLFKQKQPEQPVAQSQSRTRKSFFNFGGD